MQDQHEELSEKLLEIFAREFAIAKNLGKESGPDRLARVHRNDSGSPVLMPQKVVATSNPAFFNAATRSLPRTLGSAVMPLL